MRGWEVPDANLEPPEQQEPPQRCDLCGNWRECPCGCGMGWCIECREFTEPDGSEECGGFDGEAPEEYDDPRIDMMREEG